MFITNTLSRLRHALRNHLVTRGVAERGVTCRPEKQELRYIKESCERVLLNNILPFWYSQTIDLQTGGYCLNHRVDGAWRGAANKSLVTQARTLWFFSRITNSEYGTGLYLDAAHHGYAFLREHMWDRQHGGFYWEVDVSGNNPTKPDKHLYAQAFGLYALLEYAKASGDSSAMALAQELFSLLENPAHDAEHGGYGECFRRDWSRFPEDHISYMNVAASHKLMNTHLHLLEAMTQYYCVTKDLLARERLFELLFILSNTVVDKTFAVCRDKYQHNWKPLKGLRNDRVSYGHQLENIWILMESCRVVDLPNDPLLGLYRSLFDYALLYGFDQGAGGFYHAGPFNGVADQRGKIWWVQAECLVSALWMYDLTSEKMYFDCFLRTLDWIMKCQVDWKGGDWHMRISEAGKPSGDKTGTWKSPYHNGRAMLQCLEWLSVNDPSVANSTDCV